MPSDVGYGGTLVAESLKSSRQSNWQQTSHGRRSAGIGSSATNQSSAIQQKHGAASVSARRESGSKVCASRVCGHRTQRWDAIDDNPERRPDGLPNAGD